MRTPKEEVTKIFADVLPSLADEAFFDSYMKMIFASRGKDHYSPEEWRAYAQKIKDCPLPKTLSKIQW